MRHSIIAIFFALATIPAEAQTPKTRSEALQILRETKGMLFRDPSSLKGSALGQVQATDEVALVCLRTNARNGFGGYTGAQEYIIAISPERLPRVALGLDGIVKCDSYQPAPELDER
jgi:hypothetical protein